jgi:hypothetical protein
MMVIASAGNKDWSPRRPQTIRRVADYMSVIASKLKVIARWVFDCSMSATRRLE